MAGQMMSLAALVAAREAGRAKPAHMAALARDAVARRDGEIKAFCHLADDPVVAAEGSLAGVAIAASMLGTTLARRILEAMTDQQFVAWSNKLITTIACYYIAYGGWLLVRTPVLAAFDKGGLQ